MKKINGFTLLEVLVVVVIVGILAALAIPQYRKASESSKAAEAYNNLNAIRKAEWINYNRYGTFTADLNSLCIENPNLIPLAPQGNRCFEYSVLIGVPGNFLANIIAMRMTGPYQTQYIAMDANGNIDESHWLR